MSRYLKHKKQEEYALRKKKVNKLKKEQKETIKCKLNKMWENLKEYLKDYIEVKSPYSDDLYLVKPEDVDKISFKGKPEYSLRFSNHWNWYSKKDEDIQCASASEYLRKHDQNYYNIHKKYGMVNQIKLWQICIYINGEYRLIAGEYLTYNGQKGINIPKNFNKLINSLNNNFDNEIES